jgi:hypothetical protein
MNYQLSTYYLITFKGSLKSFKLFGQFLCLLFLFQSCGFKVDSVGSNLLSESSHIISGVINPLLGSIAEDQSQNQFFMSKANATACASPVYVKLYALNSDGSITDGNPLTSQLIGSDARYSFNLNELKITSTSQNVELIVKAEGCNNDVFKRPVTNIDGKQDLDAKTTVVAEVINSNSLLNKTLDKVSKKDIEILINSVSGSTTTSALSSLTTDSVASNKFNEIFGTSPTVILSARPEVFLNLPSTNGNELAISHFSVSTFHVDPNYSFAYIWKLDGIVKSSAGNWNFIPTANDSGIHQIDLYVGNNDGTGNIDLTKPYFVRTVSFEVLNTMMATPPNLSINSTTPSPRNTNTVLVDLALGVSFENCASFSHLAISESATPPGMMQFNIDCTTSGTQTENVIFSSSDGIKNLYLWAIDGEGNISNAKSLSLVVDTLPPVAAIISPTILLGGSTHSINLSASDAGVGLSALDLYFSANGGATYSLLSHLTTNDTTYNWNVPAINITNGKLKLVATDLTSSTTIASTSLFEIDSAASSAPSISRTTNAFSSSQIVSMTATCSADYAKILYSESATTPALNDPAWEDCAISKNFTASTGDGVKTIYAWTRDLVGNISSSSNVTMTLDTTMPTLSFSTFNSGGAFKGGSTQAISWLASDAHLAANPISLLYSTDGTTYNTIVSSLTNSGSYSWTLPSINSSTVTLKMTGVDLTGNQRTLISNSFIIDSIAPVVTVTDLV